MGTFEMNVEVWYSDEDFDACGNCSWLGCRGDMQYCLLFGRDLAHHLDIGARRCGACFAAEMDVSEDREGGE